MTERSASGTILRRMKAVRHAGQLPRRIGCLARLMAGLLFLNLRALPERMIDAGRALLEASRWVEPKFLEMGDALQTLYSDLESMGQRIRDVMQQLTGTEGRTLMGRAVGVADEARHILAHYQDRALITTDPVKDLIGHLDVLFSGCDQIDRIATNLRVVGINIGVESTRSEAAREMFHIVSEDIIKFSDSIVAVGKQIRGDVRAARDCQERVLKEISCGISEFRHLFEDAAGVIQTSTEGIDTCMGIAGEVFDASGRRFEEISRQVGEIVAAVQFHDSMRQRIEHIAAALTKAGRRIFEKPGPGLLISRLAAADASVMLQRGQLRDVIREIRRIYEQSAGAFEVIERSVLDLAANIATASERESKSSIRDPFGRLVTSLKQLVSLIDRADRLMGMLDESVATAADISERFSRYIRKVEKIGIETHFMALNAIIKAGHLGREGQTLEVLAQEMSAISNGTDEFVGGMKEKLDQVNRFADSLERGAEADAAPAADALEPLSQPGEGAIGRLSAAISEIGSIQARMKEQVDTTADQADNLARQIRDSRERLCFLPSLADEINRLSEPLGAAARQLQAFGLKAGMASEGRAGADIDAYTMQRERDIHEDITLFANGAEPEAGAMEPACPTEDAEAESADPAELSALPATAEDWQTPEPQANEFGENVELF